MRKFKSTTDRFVESHEITKENVQKYLTQISKYTIQTKNGKRYVAVCPACRNPIRLFGITKEIYKTLENGEKVLVRPYAKHYEHDVKGIADYDKFSYEICPLSSHYRWTNIEDSWDEPQPINYEIYNALRENVDTVLYILAQSIGIRYFTYAEAKEMLKSYLDFQGYMWKAATVDNLPWFLFYTSGANFRIWNKIVIPDTPLYEYLKTRKDIKLIPEYRNDKLYGYRVTSDNFLKDSIEFGVYNRDCNVDEDLEEYVDCRVYRLDGKPPGKILWQTRIFVDLNIFAKTVNSTKRVRNEKLKALGENELPVMEEK